MQTFTIDHTTFRHYEQSVYAEAQGQLWATCKACGSHEKIARSVQNAAEARTLADDYVHRHDCSPSRGRTPPPPDAGKDGLVWLITDLLDLGPLHQYRYRVSGEIWNQGQFVDEFTWHFQDLDDPRFYIPSGPEFSAVCAALEKARMKGR